MWENWLHRFWSNFLNLFEYNVCFEIFEPFYIEFLHLYAACVSNCICNSICCNRTFRGLHTDNHFGKNRIYVDDFFGSMVNLLFLKKRKKHKLIVLHFSFQFFKYFEIWKFNFKDLLLFNITCSSGVSSVVERIVRNCSSVTN